MTEEGKKWNPYTTSVLEALGRFCPLAAHEPLGHHSYSTGRMVVVFSTLKRVSHW
jgi:hypothetical protein